MKPRGFYICSDRHDTDIDLGKPKFGLDKNPSPELIGP